MNDLARCYLEGSGVRQDDEAALEWFLEAAEQGYDAAQSNLGVLYAEGRGVEQDWASAITWQRRAAETGGVLAEFRLASHLLRAPEGLRNVAEARVLLRGTLGRGTEEEEMDTRYLLGQTYATQSEPDWSEAGRWYREAAVLGHVEAARAIGALLAFAPGGGAPDVEQGEQWLRVAIERGDPRAAWELAQLIHRGDVAERAPSEARELVRMAANGGVSDAEVALAAAIAEERGGSYDPKLVRRLEAAAREDGLYAQMLLARYYLSGPNGPRAPAKARRLLRRGAESGLASAQRTLGVLILEGYGAPQDSRDSGLELLRRAAEADDVEAMLEYGRRLAQRDGPREPDEAEGFRWIERAADRGNPRALEILGRAALVGKGVPKDPSRAVELWNAAAEAGSVVARRYLMNVYFDWPGIPRDLHKSAIQAQACAPHGFSDCQSVLGAALYTGTWGLPQDVAEGIRWLRLAVEQNEARAHSTLAIAYTTGVGVPRDLAKAEELVRESVRLGFTNAQKQLDSIVRLRRESR